MKWGNSQRLHMPLDPNALFSGFGLALSFILAIGAQNAYILKQGLKRQHVFAVCLTCGLSDTVLIIAGVVAQTQFADIFPKFSVGLQYIGTAFLTVYGIKCFYNAFTVTHGLEVPLDNKDKKEEDRDRKAFKSPMFTAILTALAFTWLNPHVYIDTVLIIGSLSLKFADAIMSYTLGAVSASYFYFFSLGYGARILTPLFKNPRAWKILDGVIGGVMLFLAWSLLNSNL